MPDPTPLYTELTAEWFQRELDLTDNLAALAAEGLPYADACRAVFEGPGIDTPPAVRRAWVASVVAGQIAGLRKRLPWLGATGSGASHG